MRKFSIITLCILILIYFLIPEFIMGVYSQDLLQTFRLRKNTLRETNSSNVDKKVQDLSKFSLIYRVNGRIFSLLTEAEEIRSIQENPVNDFAVFLDSSHFLTFNREVWAKVSKEKDKILESSVPSPKEISKFAALSSKELSKSSVLPSKEEGIGINLPYESTLTISGRKEIGLKYEYTHYYHSEEERTTSPKSPGKNFDIEQKLQARIKGKVGNKITVNVDYDDTKFDKRDISILYKGDPEEVVQEAAFGDIDLSLPSTEFVAYNKKLFGAKLDAKYKGLRFMAIGSKIKGISDYREFSGRTTFQKKEVYDTSYVRRKYYKLYFEEGHLPLLNGTEQIYIDDKNISNNTSNTRILTVYDYYNSTGTYTGSFDLQSPGEDYTVDYNKGIITFSKNVGNNYIIAVRYKYQTGEVGYSSELKMIKNENESIDYALKNYYDLGQNKILSKGLLIKIQDLNRDPNTDNILYENETDKSQFPYQVDFIDLDLGILKFKEETPFPGYIYHTNPVHQYFINIEYKYSLDTYRLGRIDVIKGSEEVRVDGQKVTRDVDYLIDYDIGLITFLREDLIKEDSKIRIDFEYMPFGGQLQQTLVGARGELNLYRNWFIGSTFMYDWSAPPSYIPDIKGAPESIVVLEADTKYKFEPKSFPIKAELSGEIAHSQRNMNTYGKAMIDNMEGTKTQDSMPTSKKLWLPASNPQQSIDKRRSLELNNEDVKAKDINPNSLEEGDRQVLSLNYNLPETDSWSAILYSISKTGANYSKKNFLEMQIYGEGGGEELHIDLGRVSEDIDGDDFLDTEDSNENNELDVNEDSGIDLSEDQYGNSTNLSSNYGAGNGQLDTEDLDQDGLLDGEGFIYSISELMDTNEISHNSVDWVGWKTFRIPLDINSANQDQWENIKHIRLWLKKGLSAMGTIKIASISIVGNAWEEGVATGVGKLSVRAINNEDDTDYEILVNNSDYEDLYSKTGEKKDEDDKEQALSLEYTLDSGEEGYTKKVFSTAQNYQDYKQLKLFVYGTNAETATFYLSLGTSSAYFQFKRKVNWIGWKLITLNLNDINGDYLADDITSDDGEISKVSIPSLGNITEIKLGLINETGISITDGEIWVNEIHLSEGAYRKGWAKRLQLNTSYKDWFSLIGNFKVQDRNFETIGKKSQGQDNTSYRLDPRISYFKYLPITGHWSKTETVTPTTIDTSLSSNAEGTVIVENRSIGTDFKYKKLPHFNAKISQSLSDIELQQRNDRTDIFSGNGDYNIASKFFLFPKRLKFGYTRTNAYIDYRNKDLKSGYDDSLENADDWSGEIDFKHSWGKVKNINYFNLTPSYQIKRAELQKELQSSQKIKNPKYTEQRVGLRTNLKLFGWFSPQLTGNINLRDDYNVNPSSYTVISKNIRRDSIIDAKIPFIVNDFNTKLKIFNSLQITPEYKMERRDNYEEVDSSFFILDKLWVNDKLDIEQNSRLTYARDNFRTQMRWKPLEFLDLKKGLKPIRTLDTRVKYDVSEEHRETTGTPFDTYISIWPDLEFILSDVEYFPLFYKFMQGSHFSMGYSKREIDKKMISLSKTETWKFKWDFRLIKKYTWILEYQDNVAINTNPEGIYISSNISQTAGAQVNFNMLKNLRFKIRYDDRTTKQRGQTSGFTIEKTPSLNMQTDLKFAHGLRLPLIKKPFQLNNALKLSTTLKTIMQSSNVTDNNKNTYSADVNVNYDLSTNFMFTLGTGFSKVEYTQFSQNNYWTFSLLLKLLIKF